MVEHHDDLSRLITIENGKALSDAIVGVFLILIDGINLNDYTP